MSCYNRKLCAVPATARCLTSAQPVAWLVHSPNVDRLDFVLCARLQGANDPTEQKFSYFAQIKVHDDQGRELMSILSESEGSELVDQGAFIIPAESKTTLLPSRFNGAATVSVSLNGGGGSNPWETKGSLQLLEGKKKQWLQLGFDPFGLRVQLHVLAEADGSGFHLIHARITPPPLCALTLQFTARGSGNAISVRARGRGVAPQTPFEVEQLDKGLRVPKHCSAAAILVVAPGQQHSETCGCEPVDLSLAGATQMVWKQLGTTQHELRVQVKLAPANEGGYLLTAIRVTPPGTFRTPAAPKTAPTVVDPSQTSAAPAQVQSQAKTAAKESPPLAEAGGPSSGKRTDPVPEAWSAADDDVDRIVEIEPEAENQPPVALARSAPPRCSAVAQEPSPATTEATSVAAAPAGAAGAASVDEQPAFVAASTFAGARLGYVFKKGARGMGYYVDAAAPKGNRRVEFATTVAPEGVSDVCEADTSAQQASIAASAAAEQKQAADALFAAGDAKGAANAYTALLHTMPPSTSLGHTALSNRSACYLAMEEWGPCAADCDEALQTAHSDLPPRAKIKLHLRRAEARLAIGLREMASTDVHEASRLVRQDDTASEAQINAFKARLAALKPAVPAAALVSASAHTVSKPTPSSMPAPETASGEDQMHSREEITTVPEATVSVDGEAHHRAVTVRIALPGVTSIGQMSVEISESDIHVSGCGYSFDQRLPFTVNADEASAKFSRKDSSLRVRATEAS